MGASLPDNKINGVENRILDELYNRKSFDNDPEIRVRVGSQEEPNRVE